MSLLSSFICANSGGFLEPTCCPFFFITAHRIRRSHRYKLGDMTVTFCHFSLCEDRTSSKLPQSVPTSLSMSKRASMSVNEPFIQFFVLQTMVQYFSFSHVHPYLLFTIYHSHCSKERPTRNPLFSSPQETLNLIEALIHLPPPFSQPPTSNLQSPNSISPPTLHLPSPTSPNPHQNQPTTNPPKMCLITNTHYLCGCLLGPKSTLECDDGKWHIPCQKQTQREQLPRLCDACIVAIIARCLARSAALAEERKRVVL